MYIWHSTQCRV